jgi:hypothetical protein
VNYEFTGQSPRFYPEITGEAGSLIAVPGDVRAFDVPPADGLWAETGLPVTDPGPRQWPLKAEVLEAPAVAVDEVPPVLPFGPPADLPANQES